MRTVLVQIARRCLAPPCCEACDRFVVAPPALCPACSAALIPLRFESCRRCALPFPRGAVGGHHCEECLRSAPGFARARAVFEFAGTAERLLRALKFGGRETALWPLLPWALPVFREALRDFSPQALFPVPLGAWRRFRRGFNQSYVLAEALREAVGSDLPLLVGAGRRRTPPQARRGRAERLRAMRGVFAVRDPASVRGRRILVVDDVMTTGATVDAFGKSLLQAGAEAVQVFVLARTARD